VKLCNPFPEHVQRHALIAKGLKESDARDKYDKIQDRGDQEIVTEWGTTNVMVDTTDSEMEWNEPFFRDSFDNTVKIVTWVSRKHKSFNK
jgi:hypothetical protein